MSVSTVQSQVLLTAGIVCVVAAIVGGGMTYKDFTIPKILSLKRQLLLGGFGALLILPALGFIFGVVPNLLIANPGIVFAFVWAALILASLIRAGARQQKYKEALIRHRDRPKELVEDAEKAFWNCHYKWTVKYVSQAKAAARDDGWQSGYAFLLGSHLALDQKDAARTTRIDIVSSVKKAANDKTSYFSSREALHQLASDLAAIRVEIAKDGMTKRHTEPIRAEIDLVLQAVNDVLRPV